MSVEQIRTEALDLIRAGELDLTGIWIELLARGGEGTVGDLDEFLSGLDPVSDSYALLLAITLKEIQHD